MAAPNTIFEIAHKGDFETIKAKIEEDPSLIGKTDGNGRILLHWAVLSGNFKLVSHLVEMGSSVDMGDDTDSTPLVLAASAGRTEVVDLLIKNKADVNHKTSQGHSALQYAASKGWSEICKNLIENGADVNIADCRGATPLHRAASKGNLSVVKFLLQFKALDVDQTDVCGNTALHLACEEDRQEEAKLLVGRGARVDVVNKEKKTALDLCSRGLFKILTAGREEAAA